MNKFGRIYKLLRLQLLMMALYIFSVGHVLGVENNQEIKPEKPIEAFLIMIFDLLADQVGKIWAIVLLIFIGGIIGYLVKDAIPQLCKWIVGSIIGWFGRFYGQNLKAYLNSVIADCKEVRVGYKNFEIDVHRDYVSLHIKTGKSQRDVEIKEVYAVIVAHQRLVVRGHPGAGKTTLLKYLSIRYAKRLMKKLHGKHLIPVFVPLKNVFKVSEDHPKELFAYLVELFKRQIIDAEDYLNKQLKEGNCIVFLDGMDEVDADNREVLIDLIEAFARDFDQVRMIITLRKEGYEKVGFSARFEEVEVAPLTIPQMDNLAFSVLQANQTKSNTEKLRRQCKTLIKTIGENDRLLMLAENPMLLSIIALVFDEEGDLPRKRVELYERCVKLILEVREHREARIKYRLRFTFDQKYTALRKLAWYCIQQNIAQFSGNVLKAQFADIVEDINIQHGQINTFIEELCIIGILRRISEFDDTYDFVHKTFLEYFAAREIQENKDEEDLIYTHAKDPNWREVILLYVGLLGDSKQVITELFKQGQLALAGECFLHARIPVEAIRSDLIKALFAHLKAEESDKQRITDVLMEMILPRLEKVIGQPVEQDFLESRLKDLLERPAIKSAIYQAALGLEPTLAGEFGERFDLAYVPAGKSFIRVESPISYRPSLKEKLYSWIKREPTRTDQFELSRQEVDLPAYFIDKFPVTNQEFGLFIKAGGYRDSRYWSEAGWDYISNQESKEPKYWQKRDFKEPDQPVVGVCWYEADAYGRWAGKQLPIEQMWEKAARGIDERSYPWGNAEPGPNLCNYNRNIGKTTPVKTYASGVSPYGLYDMSGNVWEWCDDWWSNEQDFKVIRGGSWGSNPENLRASDRFRSYPGVRSSSIGFRCARTL